MKKTVFSTAILLGIATGTFAQANKDTKNTETVTKMEKVKITDADRQAADGNVKKEKVKRQQKASTVSAMTYDDQKDNKDSKTEVSSAPIVTKPSVKSKNKAKKIKKD